VLCFVLICLRSFEQGLMCGQTSMAVLRLVTRFREMKFYNALSRVLDKLGSAMTQGILSSTELEEPDSTIVRLKGRRIRIEAYRIVPNCNHWSSFTLGLTGKFTSWFENVRSINSTRKIYLTLETVKKIYYFKYLCNLKFTVYLSSKVLKRT
jgi:hypothetical protein